MAKIKLSECFKCVQESKEEIQAIKALGNGDATEFQQKLALKVITNSYCRAHDLSYIPSSYDQTAFIAGRAFVGQRILKVLKIPIGKLIPQEATDEHK